MSRFLVYTSPAMGHTIPLVPGLLALQARGHDVHVRVHPALVDDLRAAGLDAAPVSPEVMAVPVTDFRAASEKERMHSGQSDLMTRGIHDGPDLAAAAAEFGPDVLLLDVNAYGAQVYAETTGLPRAVLLPSVVPLPGAGIPPYGPGLKPMGGPAGWLRDRIMWRVVERMFGAAMLPGLNRLREEAGLAPYSSPLDTFRATTIIALTAEPLEYHRTDLPANVHLVGAQPWDPPSARPAYLDEPGDPWVLVTCSTEYQGDEPLALTAIDALADEPVRVLVTLGNHDSELPGPLPTNVRVERFVPHSEVLPLASAVVCHGGMGIVTKAASAGVPIVVVPWGRDQPEIARRVTESGAGVSIAPKRLTPARLRDAVRAARGMRASAQRVAAQLDPAGAPGRFADVAEGLIGAADLAQAPRP